nr:hypothetical protein [Alilaet virus]
MSSQHSQQSSSTQPESIPLRDLRSFRATSRSKGPDKKKAIGSKGGVALRSVSKARSSSAFEEMSREDLEIYAQSLKDSLLMMQRQERTMRTTINQLTLELVRAQGKQQGPPKQGAGESKQELPKPSSEPQEVGQLPSPSINSPQVSERESNEVESKPPDPPDQVEQQPQPERQPSQTSVATPVTDEHIDPPLARKASISTTASNATKSGGVMASEHIVDGEKIVTPRRMPDAAGPSLVATKRFPTLDNDKPIKAPSSKPKLSWHKVTADNVDSELYGYLTMEFAFQPRSERLLERMTQRARIWLKGFDCTGFTDIQKHSILVASVAAAMIPPDSEMQAIKDLNSKKIVKRMQTHHSFCREGDFPEKRHWLFFRQHNKLPSA